MGYQEKRPIFDYFSNYISLAMHAATNSKIYLGVHDLYKTYWDVFESETPVLKERKRSKYSFKIWKSGCEIFTSANPQKSAKNSEKTCCKYIFDLERRD